MGSNRRGWSGWMRPDRRGAEELLGVFELVVGERCDPDQRAQEQFLLLRVGDVPNARGFYATPWKKAEYRMASSTPQLAIQPRRELFQP
jgi:hypothetical protein